MVYTKLLAENPTFSFFQENFAMTRPKDRDKFNRLDNTIWKKSHVDKKGRCVLPQKLRRKLGLNNHCSILWISVCRKNGKPNEFLLEIGVKK